MINKATIIGNLGADPETRHLEGGKKCCSFTVATTEKWKGQDGNMQESTEWHRISAWDRLGEICQEYLSKGSRVYIEGKIQTRKYVKDGQDHYATGIVAREMKMLSARSESSGGGSHNDDKYERMEPPPMESGVPF